MASSHNEDSDVNPHSHFGSKTSSNSEGAITTNNEIVPRTTSGSSISYQINDLSFLDKMDAEIRTEIHKHLTLAQTVPRPSNKISSGSIFLQALPVEIREIIYGFLLTSPVLGDCSSINKGADYGANMKYGLTPSILSVCKRVYHEASPVLYAKNIFIMACIGRLYSGKPFSPVTRYGHSDKKPLAQAGISKVRNWKIILGSCCHLEGSYSGFNEFCQAICCSPPNSVELMIIPKGVEGNPAWDYFPIHSIIQPIRFLRNLQHCSICDSDIFDIPDSVERTHDPYIFQSLVEENEALVEELTQLVKSDTAVEFPHEMYKKLLAYAQSFERCEIFRMEMEEVFPYVNGKDDELPSQYQAYRRLQLSNPFKRGRHPVEVGLTHAKSHTKDEIRMVAFKEHREIVLEYLEPQYHRIKSAAANLNAFIKEEKQTNGLLSLDVRNNLDSQNAWQIGEALVLLTEYAVALNTRDMPLAVKVECKWMSRYQHLPSRSESNWTRFNKQYSALPRETYLKSLNTIFEEDDFYDFFKLFKDAVDNMDSQYLEIRNARKALFVWDTLNECGCDVDIEMSLCDEMVNWNVDEPVLGPRTKYDDGQWSNWSGDDGDFEEEP